MKVTLKRHIWLTGMLVASLGLWGCSGGGGDMEDPLEDGEELAQDDIDSALEDMEADPLAAEPMDDYGDEGADLPMMEDSETEEPYAAEGEYGTEPTQGMADEMQDESSALVDQLDSVSEEDVENYKLEDEGTDTYVSEPEPMPEANAVAEPAEMEGSYDEATEPMVEPAPAYVDNSSSSSQTDVRYIAKPGDTLGTIAAQIYGNSRRWRDLAERNGISNPSHIFPGDVINFEVTDETRGFANHLSQIQMETVVVEAGDSLSAISQRVLGDGNAWKYLWRFNEGRIQNPDMIQVGQVISFVPVNNATGIAKAAKDSTIR